MSKSFSRSTVKAAAPAPAQVLAAQEAFRDNDALLAALGTSVRGLDEERITRRPSFHMLRARLEKVMAELVAMPLSGLAPSLPAAAE